MLGDMNATQGVPNTALFMTVIQRPTFTSIMYSATFIALLPLTALGSNALGINCRGSSECDMALQERPEDGSIASDIANALANGNQHSQLFFDSWDEVFSPGRKIGCYSQDSAAVGYICAIVKNGNATVQEVLDAANRIVAHGCKTCGSAPFNTTANDGSQGELTFDYVLSVPANVLMIF